ncbi:MAG: 30S ribosomal protein S16 [bacterium]
MLIIRLLRTGKKHQPFFRVVVCDKDNPPRGGRAVEFLGFRNPLTKEIKLNGERIKYWLSVGAQPSDTVHNLLIKEKIIEEKKVPMFKLTKKKRKEMEDAAKAKEAEKTAAEAKEKEEAKVEKTEEVATEVKEEAKEQEETKAEKTEEIKEKEK